MDAYPWADLLLSSSLRDYELAMCGLENANSLARVVTWRNNRQCHASFSSVAAGWLVVVRPSCGEGMINKEWFRLVYYVQANLFPLGKVTTMPSSSFP